MKIFAYDRIYAGTPAEILEELRQDLGDPNVTDFKGYVAHVKDVFLRFMGIALEIPEGTEEEQSLYIIKRVARLGLLEVLGGGAEAPAVRDEARQKPSEQQAMRPAGSIAPIANCGAKT